MKLLPWLILIIGGAVVWMLWPETKVDYSEYEEKIDRREKAIFELQAENTKLLARIKSDSVSHTNEIQTYKDRDKIKSREIARIKASKVVIQVRDSVPEIDSLIVAYDSLLQSKNEQIELQARYIDTLQVDIGKVTDNFMERLKLQSETIEDLNTIVEDQRKELRKERRGKLVAKILVPVVAVVAFLLGGAF